MEKVWRTVSSPVFFCTANTLIYYALLTVKQEM